MLQTVLLAVVPLLSAILVTVNSLVTSYLNNRATRQKEQETWARQQEAEAAKWNREQAERRERQLLIVAERAMAYWNALGALQHRAKGHNPVPAAPEVIGNLHQRAAFWTGRLMVKLQAEGFYQNTDLAGLDSYNDPLTTSDALMRILKKKRDLLAKKNGSVANPQTAAGG
jgi:hypothetical protein